MDETTKTGQDTSSGKTGQSSGSTGGTTSKDKGKLYTASEIDKIKSDAAAEAGRLRKAAEQKADDLSKRLQSVTTRLDSIEKEREESRLAELRNDPESLKQYQREKELSKREREADERDRDLTAREQRVKDDSETLDKNRRVVTIAYVAAKHGLDAEELESFGITDEAALEKLAEKLSSVKVKPTVKEGETPEGETSGEDETQVEVFTGDSGETTGGGKPTQEQLEQMPMEQYAKQAANRYK